MPKDKKPSNNDHQKSISPSTEAAYRQYERAAEDWRLHHNLVWQIPSVAIAIMGGILTVSYHFLDGIPRAILLGIGSALIFALTIALAKHRLGADGRSQFLLYLETEIFKVKPIPTWTNDIKNDLKNKDKLTDNRLYLFLIKPSSEMWLLGVMFGSFIVMSILVIWQIMIIVHIVPAISKW